MADTDRAAAYDLIQALRRAPYRFDFLQAMRLIECVHADRPRLGKSSRSVEDPIRLAQEPDMRFAPATLADYVSGEGARPDRLVVRFLGLFGPNGPMPSHLTEYASERIRHHGDPTFSRFTDVFHHRMLCLFYRAWANGEPTVHFDRPDDDRFSDYLGSMFGIGMEALHHCDAMPDSAKLFFAGLLACQTRHPDGLTAVIEQVFGISARTCEFVGEWMQISEPDQTRLGLSPQSALLGLSTVVGARVWARQFKFRLVLGPLKIQQYRAFLPGEARLSELVAIVRNYVADELCWDVNLTLHASEVPAMRLDGGAQLGWTSWLGKRLERSDAEDLLLNPFFGAARGTH